MHISRILVVDGDPEVREPIKTRLSMEGFNCHEAENGFECLKILRKEKFDLMITDIKVPRLDGMTLIRGLKFVRKDMGFIVISDTMNKDMKDELLSLGVKDIILKPIDLDDFSNRVKKILPLRMEHEDGEAVDVGSEDFYIVRVRTKPTIFHKLAVLYYHIRHMMPYWYRKEVRSNWLFYTLALVMLALVGFIIIKGITYMRERPKEPSVYELLKRGVEALEEDNRIDRKGR